MPQAFAVAAEPSTVEEMLRYANGTATIERQEHLEGDWWMYKVTCRSSPTWCAMLKRKFRSHGAELFEA